MAGRQEAIGAALAAGCCGVLRVGGWLGRDGCELEGRSRAGTVPYGWKGCAMGQCLMVRGSCGPS